MNSPTLLLTSLLASIYSSICLYKSSRQAQLASPHSLYAGLALLHFFLPGMLVGLGIAPDFVSHRNGHFALMAVLFSVLGLIAFQTGSIMACSGVFLKRWRFNGNTLNKRNWDISGLLMVFMSLFAVGWLSRFYIILNNAYFQFARGTQGEIEGPFYAAIRMVELFPLHLICFLSIKFWGNSSKSLPALRSLLVFSITTEVLYWLPSGRKEGVILAIILPLIIRYLMTKKLPSTRTIFLLITALVILFPLSFLYRRELEISNEYPAISEIAKSAYLSFVGGSQGERSAPEILFGRLSLLEPLCACIRIWEQDIWEPMLGSSYFSALLGLIPRFVWPEKPDLHYGNEFGYIASFISNNDFRTSISVTFYGEAYLNFGFAGFIPLFLMGVMFGLLYRNISTSKRHETSLLLYLIAIPTLLYVGGTFGLYFGGLIKIIPFYYMIGRNIEIRPKQRIVSIISPVENG